MPIRWDAVLTHHLARELEQRLDGARLRAIRLDGDRREAVLYLREATLTWYLHPTRGSVRLTDPGDPPPDALRLAGRVRRISAPRDERMIIFRVLPVRGQARSRDLVIELLGNQWNFLVVEGPDRILRHVLHTRSKGRPLRVGTPYEPPAPSKRIGTDGVLSSDEWASLTGTDASVSSEPSLVTRLAWTSPINRDALMAAEAEQGLALWRRLADPKEEAHPVLLATDRGHQPYPFPLSGYESAPMDSLLEAFATAETDLAEDEGSAALLDARVLRRLEDAARSSHRRARRLRAELEEADDPQSLRALGDLILARYHEIPSGASEATLTNFDGDTVQVQLNPSEPPHANAERYYDKAGRAQRALERLPELIREATREAETWDDLLHRAIAGEVDPTELEARLPSRPAPKAQPGAEPTLPYRRFRSSGGLEIRVGRGARRNDDLTFRHSAPTDVWLHARHTAGAHVILRWSGDDNPPARDLEEAGILAALHSKARTSGSVPIDWTRRKHVRKPRKSAPGAVLPDRVKTIFVEPDPALMDRLAD